MPTINQLPLITQLSGGDNVVLWVPNQGDSRRASITSLIQYIEENFDGIVCNTIQTTPTTYSQLPTATNAGAGTRAFITDCNVATFGTAAAGGGANFVPVYSDGTDWRVG